jgi:hypothetical protein
MAVGVAIMGRIESVRTRPRPQNSRLNSTAMPTPSTVSTDTATSVKYSVRKKASRKRTSVVRICW